MPPLVETPVQVPPAVPAPASTAAPTKNPPAPEGAAADALKKGAEILEKEEREAAGLPPTPEKPAYRSLKDLRKDSTGGKAKFTPEESKRVRIAAQYGLKTDEAIDAKLAELADKKPASQKKPEPPAKVGKDKTIPPVKPGENPSQPPKLNPKTPPPKAEAEAPAPGAEGDDDLIKLLPNVPPGDKKAAAEKIKFIRQRSDDYGALMNTLKEHGVTDHRQIPRLLQTLDSIDAEIAENLKTPEGLRKLYKAYASAGVTMPPGLAEAAAPGGAAPAPGGRPAAAAPAAPVDIWKDKDESDYLSVGEVRAALPQLIESAVRAQVEAVTGGMHRTFEELQPVLTDLATRSHVETALSQAFRDVTDAVQYAGKHDPAYALKDPPEKIWRESVDERNKLRPQPHPEWPALAGILEARKAAAAGRYPSLRSYLADQFVTTGALDKLRTDTARAAREENLTRATTLPMPALNAGRRLGDDDYRTPRTTAEIERLRREKPEHYKRFRQDVHAGRVTVKVGAQEEQEE